MERIGCCPRRKSPNRRFATAAWCCLALRPKKQCACTTTTSETEHLYVALTQIDGGMAQRLLIGAGLDPRTIRNEIRREVGASDAEPAFGGDELPLTPRAHRILAASVTLADEHGEDEVLEYHLLLALLREGRGHPGA